MLFIISEFKSIVICLYSIQWNQFEIGQIKILNNIQLFSLLYLSYRFLDEYLCRGTCFKIRFTLALFQSVSSFILKMLTALFGIYPKILRSIMYSLCIMVFSHFLYQVRSNIIFHVSHFTHNYSYIVMWFKTFNGTKCRMSQICNSLDDFYLHFETESKVWHLCLHFEQ